VSASLENFIFNVDRCAECTISAMADFKGVVYRITFIPGILLGALLAAAAATCIPLGLLLNSRKELSFRTGRVVDPLQLVVDCADALGNAELLRVTGPWVDVNWGNRRID
jgi:hypothetical protein